MFDGSLGLKTIFYRALAILSLGEIVRPSGLPENHMAQVLRIHLEASIRSNQQHGTAHAIHPAESDLSSEAYLEAHGTHKQLITGLTTSSRLNWPYMSKPNYN